MKHLTSAFSQVAFLSLLWAQTSIAAPIANNGVATDYSAKNISILVTHSPAPNKSLYQILSNYYPHTYCTDDIEAQTSHPDHQQRVIRRDIDCMMTTLKHYQQLGATANNRSDIPYFAYKAQAWLNYAYNEDSEKSLTDAEAYALNRGATILQLLKENKVDELKLTTEIPPSSAIMRPDLWSTLIALKVNGGIYSNPRELAFSEVQLMWAASEYCEQGWRHSNEHFKAAQKWIDQSQEKFINSSNEYNIKQFKKDTKNIFQIFKQLDTGDDQCRQNKITSIEILTD